MPGYTCASYWQPKLTDQTSDHKKVIILTYLPHNQDIKCNNLGRTRYNDDKSPVQALKHGRIRPSSVTTSYNGCDIWKNSGFLAETITYTRTTWTHEGNKTARSAKHMWLLHCLGILYNLARKKKGKRKEEKRRESFHCVSRKMFGFFLVTNIRTITSCSQFSWTRKHLKPKLILQGLESLGWRGKRMLIN